MFIREKKSGDRSYLQVVENRRENGKTKQRVIATLGRLDVLQKTGALDALLCSGGKFSQTLLLLSAYRRGEVAKVATRRIGPSLVFERLWKDTGCNDVINTLLVGRKFGFDVERTIFKTVLHRLFRSDRGSDRAAEKWRKKYRIEGTEELQLHHSYRAMGWLGEELPGSEQRGMTWYAPRCVKDRIEEELFARRRDLFTSLDLVFFDTTSIYFEGQGGDSLGRHGKSKDHRPDLRQMVVGVVMDGDGSPVCCEMWPGNTTDINTLMPVADRLSERFGIKRICVVADRGMFSKEIIRDLEGREWQYILGARMRKAKEVRDEVLSRGGRYQEVRPPRTSKKEPAPLKVKEVKIGERRYVVCLNEEQAKQDADDREAILEGLEKQLKRGDKSLVGNKGYRKYLKASRGSFDIDRAKAEGEARYDGKWVLRTNTKLETADVALKYKQLWMVEDIFRSMKTIVETRPIYHKFDETIRGHVFCSFLSMVLIKELQDRLHEHGHKFEWQDVVNDLDDLEEVEIDQDGKRFVLRSEAKRTCGKVFQAVGVAMPPAVRHATGNPPA